MTVEEKTELRWRYRGVEHVGEWETLEGFAEWMRKNGFDGTGKLMATDLSKPRTPDNCYISKDYQGDWRMTKAEAKAFEYRWAKAVNPLRRAAGLPLLEVYG